MTDLDEIFSSDTTFGVTSTVVLEENRALKYCYRGDIPYTDQHSTVAAQQVYVAACMYILAAFFTNGNTVEVQEVPGSCW